MKNILKAVLLLTLMVAATTAWSQSNLKIGYIDSQALIEMMPEKDTVEYQNKVADYTNNMDGMSDIIKQTKEREIADLETRITEFQNSAEQDFARKQQELYDPLVNKAKNAINEVAKANGFTYILDISMGVVLYYEGGEDVLPLVRANLGL